MKYAHTILIACLAPLCSPLPAQEAAENKTGAGKPQQGNYVFADLQPLANHKLKDSFNPEGKDNSLRSLPQGAQEFCQIRFRVGPGFIRLGGNQRTELPRTMNAIAVGSLCQKLHFLLGTEFEVSGRGAPLFRCGRNFYRPFPRPLR